MTHDCRRRGIRFHGRGVDTDPVALDQLMLAQPRQHPGKHGLVHLNDMKCHVALDRQAISTNGFRHLLLGSENDLAYGQ